MWSGWVSPNPAYGRSVFTASYYQHTRASLRRVAIAFSAALATGIPLGLLLGWSSWFRQYAFQSSSFPAPRQLIGGREPADSRADDDNHDEMHPNSSTLVTRLDLGEFGDARSASLVGFGVEPGGQDLLCEIVSECAV